MAVRSELDLSVGGLSLSWAVLIVDFIQCIVRVSDEDGPTESLLPKIIPITLSS